MGDEDVRVLLFKRAKRFAKNKGTTGVTPWCEAHGVLKSHVNEWLNGVKPSPPRAMLTALGLEVSYTRKRMAQP